MSQAFATKSVSDGWFSKGRSWVTEDSGDAISEVKEVAGLSIDTIVRLTMRGDIVTDALSSFQIDSKHEPDIVLTL